MEMRQCEKGGHYYDADLHKECPYCNSSENIESAMQLDIGRTMPVTQGNKDVENRTRAQGGISNEGRTVAIIKEKLGVDPVVGWMVSMDGKEKGRDYRIHTDNNYIGRSEKMDICIRGDDTISRENHAVVSYDVKDKIFYFSPGDGRSIVRLNNKAIFSTSEIRAYDIVEIGKTRLVFIPLCGEKFEWV